MKIYIDTCGWSRPYDEKTQQKVIDEGAAVLKIVKQARRRGFTILGSLTLEDEISEIDDAEVHVWVANLYKASVTAEADYNDGIFTSLRSQAEDAGVGGWDAYHLCYAESSKADYLFTVDKKFLKNASKLNTNVKVMNPLTFVQGGLI